MSHLIQPDKIAEVEAAYAKAKEAVGPYRHVHLEVFDVDLAALIAADPGWKLDAEPSDITAIARREGSGPTSGMTLWGPNPGRPS